MDYSTEDIFSLKTAWMYVASIGWYVVAVAVSFWLASPYIQEKYARWKVKMDERSYAAKYHKNSDLFGERISAMESSRQRMQEEYRRKCSLAQQKAKEESRKTKETTKTSVEENVSGRRQERTDTDRSCSPKRKDKALRGEYNPLMGDTSRGYRAPKRRCCGKGGCG